ncbi:MAG: DNA polymerase I, partial [Gemmatimonadota bacterium]
GIYDNLDAVGTPRQRAILAEHREAALLSKELVTIHTDLAIALDLDALKVEPPDPEKATALFAELEFHRLLERFGGGRSDVAEEARYETVDTAEGLTQLAARLRAAEVFSFDLETTSLNALEAEIVGLSFATAPGEAFYVPVCHTTGRCLPLADALAALGPVLEDPACPKVGQNVKYDLLVLARAGITVQGIVGDTMLAAYLLDPARRTYSLDVLALEYLGHKTITYAELTKQAGTRTLKPFADVEIPPAATYASEDADVTLRLYLRLLPELEQKGLLPLFRDVELPLVAVLAAIERQGVGLDAPFFSAMSVRLVDELATLERECCILAGEPFNLNSPQQLSVILFEKLKLPVVRRTRTGLSTDAEVLETLSAHHELPGRILEYRELAKLKSTYVEALPAALSATSGRLHSSFNQTVASSGRLSSSEPNLQNIPYRTTLGREIRRGFVPSEPGWLFLVSDYSQIELRILAHLSQDENLLAAFRAGHDIHRQTAALVFGVPSDEVTPALRNRAKEVNFGVVYGMGAFGLARRLGIPQADAKAFITGYFDRFAGVKRFQDETIEQARREGFVTTLLGRRRYLPEIASRNFNMRAFAERAAINSPIQGTAADLIKIAMIRIHQRLAGEAFAARMVLTVHDELVFEVPADATEALGAMVRAEMEGAIRLDVPVVVDIGTGRTWFEAK